MESRVEGTHVSQLDWKKFHRDLDLAMAYWMRDVNGSIHDPIIEFAKFSHFRSKVSSIKLRSRKFDSLSALPPPK